MQDVLRWMLPCFIAVAVTGIGCTPPAVDLTVHEGGSDERSAAFQREWLPRMLVDAREKFNPESIARDFSRLVLDPSRLVLPEPTAVRVYFVAAQGGYRSSLGYWLEGSGVDRAQTILFPDATSPKKLFEYGETLKAKGPPIDYGTRRQDAPMLPGDYVDLGTLPAETRLGFFLVSDGAVSEKGRYTTFQELNPDHVQHVVTIAYQDSPYLMMGFEDLEGGGDRTFNDVVFVVELSKNTIQAFGDAKRQQAVEILLRARAQLKAWRARIMKGAAIGSVPAGLLAAWMFRRYLRRRRVKAVYASAQESLAAADPQASLKLIREALRYNDSASMHRRWAPIELEACKQLGEAAQLQDLFTRHPDIVLKDEAASLMTARAQLETERTESFQTVRSAWQDTATEPAAWLTLEADWLVSQNKRIDAKNLLGRSQFSGPQEAERLARLAALSCNSDPAAAKEGLDQALLLAPDNPEVHRARAQLFERQGRVSEAGAAWQRSMELDGRDPFRRDHYAEFLVRNGCYAAALACWREALPPPTADTIWLKAWFWSRVAEPAEMPWKTLEIPAGPLRKILRHLIDLPDGLFWSPEAEALGQRQPEVLARPECFWLRVVQTLQDRREETALALLSTCPTDARRYFGAVEKALRQVLTYRRVQFLNPDIVLVDADTPPAWASAFLLNLDKLAHGKLDENLEEFSSLLASPRVFAELFLSVGWRRASSRLFL